MLTALTPSKAWSERHGRRHRPVTDWARRLLVLRRWLPDRPLVAVMDGEFAALEPLHALRPRMAVIARLRRDARLFDPPCGWDRRGVVADSGLPNMHAFGAAIDVGVRYSAYWAWSRSRGTQYDPGHLPVGIVEAFEAERSVWGGKWFHYDGMHLECRPELFR